MTTLILRMEVVEVEPVVTRRGKDAVRLKLKITGNQLRAQHFYEYLPTDSSLQWKWQKIAEALGVWPRLKNVGASVEAAQKIFPGKRAWVHVDKMEWNTDQGVWTIVNWDKPRKETKR